MIAPQPLAGVTVAVTRPAKQAGVLCRLIEAQGGKALALPALEIVACEQTEQLTALLNRLGDYDLAIFISSNAVEGAARLVGAALPSELQLAAVGSSTRASIEQHWHRSVLCPVGTANSEALLALPEMQQVADQRIIIFRGQGGRELLAETLRQRGATVDYAEVYRRIRPTGDLQRMIQHRPVIDLITATSNEILQNLYDMAVDDEQRRWLCEQQLIVISSRGATLAEKLGFTHPAIISARSSDQGVVDAVVTWRQQHQHE